MKSPTVKPPWQLQKAGAVHLNRLPANVKAKLIVDPLLTATVRAAFEAGAHWADKQAGR